MNLFKSYTFSWQQVGVFKLALLSMGAAIGAYWYEVFIGLLPVLIVVAVVAGAYVAVIALRQH